jgi:predicted P-loop ATPase
MWSNNKIQYTKSDKEGNRKIMTTKNNLLTILTEHPDFMGRLRFNEFTHQSEFDGHIITDIDYTRIEFELSSKLWLEFNRSVVINNVEMIASLNRYNPLVDYLNSIKWDGKDRVQDFFTAMAIEDTELNRLLIHKWLLSAVGRAFQPGCKVDTTLVIKGFTGNGKSTALKNLCPKPEWFCDEPIDFGSKDSKAMLVGKWIVELSELSSFKSKDNELIKQDLSHTHDEFRAPYDRKSKIYPRSYIYVGTTNNSEILNDSTSNRRFWIVENEGIIDNKAIISIRDQLWAQIVAEYKAGAKWHVAKETELQISQLATKYENHDAWTEKVDEYLNGRDYATTADILQHLGFSIDRMDNGHKARIVKIMQFKGWNNKNKRIDGYVKRAWVNPASIDGKEITGGKVIPFGKPIVNEDDFDPYLLDIGQ